MRSAGAIVQRNDSQPAIPVAAAIHCSNSTSTVLDLGQHSQATVKTRCLSEVHLLSSISKLKAVYKVLVYPVGYIRYRTGIAPVPEQQIFQGVYGIPNPNCDSKSNSNADC